MCQFPLDAAPAAAAAATFAHANCICKSKDDAQILASFNWRRGQPKCSSCATASVVVSVCPCLGYLQLQWHSDGKRRRGKEWGAERTRRTFSLTDPNSTNTLRNCLWESSDNNLDSTKYTQTTWQNKQTREGVYIQISVYIYVYIRLYLYLWMRCLSVCVSVGPLKPCQKQPQAHEHTNKNRQ